MISNGFLLFSFGFVLISIDFLWISLDFLWKSVDFLWKSVHFMSRTCTFQRRSFFILFHTFSCFVVHAFLTFSYAFIRFNIFSYFSLKCSPTFSYVLISFSNSFLLFPRSFPDFGFSNSNVLFLYYFIVCWHRRSMGQKLGAARGAPKRHLQVISWPLAGDIVRGGRPLKSTKNNGKINQNQQIAPLKIILWGIPWSGRSGTGWRSHIGCRRSLHPTGTRGNSRLLPVVLSHS